ncbi:Elongator complex protein 5 [Madurella mycetomatis]|uniref:Elongator complex protein 5 n=1 Tax=Madurella mycetomatis TaxID=100816 RepID=A0A175WCW3_9PEZI|nr:Elongator complex protein 5 [Madurella mycetomatis]
MAPSAQTHQRTHSLLLFQKLLSLRDNASPLTLILDSLEQSAGPLVREFMNSAKTSRAKVVFVSFATIKKPPKADIFMKGRGKPLNTLAAEIASHVASKDATAASQTLTRPEYLIVIDTLNPAASQAAHLLPAFFSAIIAPSTSLVAVYHCDVPVPAPGPPANEYAPHPLTLLSHLATTVFRVSNLSHAAEARTAQRRSVQAPEFGLREGREGVLIGLRGQGENSFERGLVVEMEMRRRSGRAVVERFVLVERKGEAGENNRGMGVVLWDAHPAFREEAVDDGREGRRCRRLRSMWD